MVVAGLVHAAASGMYVRPAGAESLVFNPLLDIKWIVDILSYSSHMRMHLV